MLQHSILNIFIYLYIYVYLYALNLTIHVSSIFIHIYRYVKCKIWITWIHPPYSRCGGHLLCFSRGSFVTGVMSYI